MGNEGTDVLRRLRGAESAAIKINIKQFICAHNEFGSLNRFLPRNQLNWFSTWKNKEIRNRCSIRLQSL